MLFLDRVLSSSMLISTILFNGLTFLFVCTLAFACFCFISLLAGNFYRLHKLNALFAIETAAADVFIQESIVESITAVFHACQLTCSMEKQPFLFVQFDKNANFNVKTHSQKITNHTKNINSSRFSKIRILHRSILNNFFSSMFKFCVIRLWCVCHEPCAVCLKLYCLRFNIFFLA